MIQEIKSLTAFFIREFKIQGKQTNKFLFEEGIHQWLYEDAQKQILEAEKVFEQTLEKYTVPERELERQTQKWLTVTKPSHDRAVRRLLRSYRKTGNLGGKKALNTMGFENLDFNLQDPKIIERFKKRGNKITGVIAQNTLRRFRKLLIKGYYELGEDPRTVAKIIDNLFEKTYRGRALTIARTETAIAQAEVQHETYVNNGVKMRTWLSVKDAKTRSSHADFRDTQSPRNINIPFVIRSGADIGAKVRFPHDPLAPVSQLANCRCDQGIESFYSGEKPTEETAWNGA
jgi:hypothetical protein